MQPWLNDSYKLIIDILNKEIPYHILLSAKSGENELIWYIIISLLCTRKTVCNRCTSCNLIKETKNHPDLCYLKIENANFNIDHLDQLLTFSKHLPVFCKFKIIVILYEKDNINENSLLLMISLFKQIKRYYSYNKILLKVNIDLKKDLLSYLLTYCMHIHVNPPSEEMCILWLKENYKITERFSNDDLLTALRINRNILKETILFLKIYWFKYINFIQVFLKNINNNNYCYIFQYILYDLKNSIRYLYWLIEFLLDILKIKYSDNCITNKRYYLSIFNKEFNNKLIYNLLKDVIDCYSKLIRYPLINIELILLELTTKWILLIK